MREIMGQISLFDILGQQNQTKNEPPILLKAGEKVFKVLRGEVIRYVVHDEKSWICGENERGYRLKKVKGCWGSCINSEIGKTYFTDYEIACSVAKSNLGLYEVISAESIKPIKTVAYLYRRECDNREMIAFYSVLDNGMMYVKQFYTYHHIVNHNAKNIKKFMKGGGFEYCNAKEIEFEPVFKNMYKCHKDADWIYAEAEYSGCTQERSSYARSI